MDDLYKTRWGAIIALVAVVFFLGGFYFDIFVRNLVWILFFALFGVFNVVNWNFSEKSRYLVTAVVFFLAAVVGVINIFVFEVMSWRAIWMISIVLFVLAVPIAALFRSFWERDGDEKT